MIEKILDPKAIRIVILILGWAFGGSSQIFNNFPLRIQEAEAAFANGYTYRRLIDITNAQVPSGPHTNFPILISSTLADLKTTGNGGKVTDAQGDDIIFTDSNGTTQLAHEVEKYVTTTGELVAWVRVPSLAATSTIYIYYGNSSVTTFQGSVTSNGVTGTWDANYISVWHMPDGTTLSGTDSTSNGNSGTVTNAAAAAGLITTEFNNMRSPSGFYSVGNEEQGDTGAFLTFF